MKVQTVANNVLFRHERGKQHNYGERSPIHLIMSKLAGHKTLHGIIIILIYFETTELSHSIYDSGAVVGRLVDLFLRDHVLIRRIHVCVLAQYVNDGTQHSFEGFFVN